MLTMIRRLLGDKDMPERSPQAQEEADREARKLALYHFEGCPFCWKVRRALTTLRIDITMHDIQKDPAARAQLVAGGGKQTVPCLRIDEGGTTTWLYESSDIVEHLKNRFAVSPSA
ncbi:glutathione S-transferase N-terminal domain-containing protein [Modicisalibacter sp. 'Wilcox']|uniref:glutaredoxin family protein n=1 Tax=Modicisalibacter sp. 'Wilcox' TaxID=2679914 RepID=UPI0013D48207|nr:glutathione S-transferase N-terminal domain-containing protein [Modicisalibacter sp. 'Wilcox']